ncbi:MAG TPA: preprotein translocase subunit SecG [Alphaproteobacteria bacterium]|nr:preprotein translocase subunit SecG [Rhodospirillaceae bacterium]HRJ12425.1 preprotein translocase subunit SecG [Alphaproteobacteria bacterium]
MESVVLVIHLFLAIALIGVILLQPTADGGGLTSSSSSMSGFMSPRGSANLLTRATGILAFLFMVTSLTLVILSGAHKPSSILDQIDEAAPVADVAVPTTSDGKTPAESPAKAPTVPVGE